MPLVLTLMVIAFLIDFFTTPVVSLVSQLLSPMEASLPFRIPQELTLFLSRMISLVLICVLIFILGIFSRWFLMKSFLKLIHYIMGKIPVVRWVYKLCREVFSALFATPPPVAINISARSIAQENFVEDFLATVDGYKVAHERIGVEITETVLMTDLEVSINSISRLDKQGFRIFLDDFGTGYSSLSYLHSMPISCLKIDKKFVDEIFSQQNKSDKIVTTIINLASSLDVDVIAEGVETKEQLAFLVKNKCNIIQGYLYSRPLPKDDYINFCQNFTKPVAAEVQ